MRLRIFTEPQQGATYEQLLAVARCAEEEGYDAFFRSDHYLHMSASGLPGPSDAWITLAGLARETERIRLGTLVTSATFRLPGPLAIQVAGVDAMSGGRVELGLGAGWFEPEHRAYGIPFPPVKERFDRLEEQLAIITGLWATPADATFSYPGQHYQLTDSPARPKPVQAGGRVPIIVGGKGARRTPSLAARYADEFNIAFSLPHEVAEQYARVDRACEAIGRDPASLPHTVAVVICCGTDAAEVKRRAADIGRDPDELAVNGACGSPEKVADKLQQWIAVGATTVYLQIHGLDDLDHLRLIAREVLPRLG